MRTLERWSNPNMRAVITRGNVLSRRALALRTQAGPRSFTRLSRSFGTEQSFLSDDERKARIKAAVLGSADSNNDIEFAASYLKCVLSGKLLDKNDMGLSMKDVLMKFPTTMNFVSAVDILLRGKVSAASLGSNSEHSFQAIQDFLSKNATLSPSFLQDLVKILEIQLEQRGSSKSLGATLLALLHRGLADDETSAGALRLLGSTILGDKNVAENIKNDSASAVAAVLEMRRIRRKSATVQQLQKNEWTDGSVFTAADGCLKALEPYFESEKLQKSRTDFSKAKRLLLFAPSSHSLHNVKSYIAEMAQKDLLSREEDHPLAMLASLIRTSVFADFDHFGPNVDPVVTTKQCFDDLLVPADHVSRRTSDTFYLREGVVLRAHTSAHQTEFLKRGSTKFLVSGDVYRRDEIDKTHLPVFHQMEGVKVLPPGSTEEDAFEDLKSHLNRLADVLFPGMPRKWIDAYFPFTNPSLELEIDFKGKSIELLGCGVVQPQILKSCGLEGRVGWAFGLGLERLAMILFQIPDIRLFWTDDKRFLDQFVGCKQRFAAKGKVPKFKPFSKFPPTKRDISFWLPAGQTAFHVNDFFSIVREISGDDVEEVTVIDEFVGPDGRNSKAFRIVFRSDFRTLSGVEVNRIVETIVKRLEGDYQVQVR